ncbi:MAG TPA: tetratricopeptide repeat protein, partial [Thermoanaerobaculia bacterium]|nr:tetratricopeptide repeat protein [Thermoanaerobaculia bacterium]
MHLDDEIRPPSSINPRVPDALERIIMKLLEKDPRHRFPSAAAMLQAVAVAAGKTAPAAELLIGRGELYAAPLIGRKNEVTQLMSLIVEAREGRGNGVILAGAEGMGKSRIVRDVTLRAQLEGGRVFCGRCPVNRKTIYAPFFEIFQQMVTAVNPTADVAEEIRRILKPVVAQTPADVTPAQHGQKYRLYNRIVQSMQDIYGFLSASAESGGLPLILVIDDLQWADPSTAELFSFLIGEAQQNRLVVIGTLTLETGGEAAIESSSPNLAFWEQAAKDSGFPIIRVETLSEPLVREHVQSLLGDQNVSDEFVRWMLWESGGSPVNIRRIIDYLISHEFLQWEPTGWIADMTRIRTLRIPGGSGAILMEKVEALPPSKRAMLELTAVYGEIVEIDTLIALSRGDLRSPESSPDNGARAVADRPYAESAYRTIRELVALGLLDETADGTAVSFPQIHLRDAVYNAMSDRHRTELHLRVGNVLEPQFLAGASQLIGQIAYHFARANDIDRGVRYSIEAGDLATRTLAHEEATESYRVAIELMDLGGVEETRKSEVREKLADSYYRRDDYRGAMHAYQFLLKSIQARNQGDEPNVDVARVMKKIGKVLTRRGEHDAAMNYFHNALTIYEQLGQRIDVAELWNRISNMHRGKDDLASATDAANRALEFLEGTETSAVLGYVKNSLGLIEYGAGHWQRSREHLLEALAIGEKVGSDTLCKIAATNVGNTLWKLGDWEQALRHYRMMLEISEAEGDLWNLVTAYNNVGIVEYCRGNFHVALDYFERSVRIDEKIGAVEAEALALENYADALEMVGRWDEARAQYERCLNLEGFDETRAGRSSVYVPLARLTTKKGDIAKALEYAQKALVAAERARDEDLVAETSYVLAHIEDERE